MEERRERQSHRGVEVRGKIIIGMTFSSNEKNKTQEPWFNDGMDVHTPQKVSSYI